jgi:hypothetical protein
MHIRPRARISLNLIESIFISSSWTYNRPRWASFNRLVISLIGSRTWNLFDWLWKLSILFAFQPKSVISAKGRSTCYLLKNSLRTILSGAWSFSACETTCAFNSNPNIEIKYIKSLRKTNSRKCMSVRCVSTRAREFVCMQEWLRLCFQSHWLFRAVHNLLRNTICTWPR